MKTILGFAVAILLLACLSAAHACDQAQVQTDTGIISGILTEYGAMYLGIPYAAPPEGELRWEPPQATTLPEAYSAVEFGASCPQLASAMGVTSIPSVNEDCLYLNVYQPKNKFSHLRKRSVMVWFHGGSNLRGAGQAYDPTRLVERGVIVVTLNYRLGALGFMAHPALSAVSAEGASGNYGIMDQQLALRWIQDNIDAFGGNPDNVTIFGQSAGAYGVLTHLASPDSEGLFHRAIIQSAGQYILNQPSLKEWEMLGLGLAAKMACTDQSLDCLKSLSVEQILANQDTGNTAGYLPVVDGQILPRTTMAAFLSGQFQQVPVMLGTTHDELSFFVALYKLMGYVATPDNYLDLMSIMGLTPDVIAAVAVEYPLENYNSANELLIAVGTDALFACNTRAALMLLSLRVRAFGYEYNDPNAPNTQLPAMSFPYGAYHGADLPYLLDSNVNQLPEFDDDQNALADTMIDYWTSFAAFGTPSSASGPFWKRYGPLFQMMNSLEPTSPQIINDYDEDHHCRFWMSLMLSR